MKTEKILLLGGLALVGYFIYKRMNRKKATIIEPQVDETTSDERKTIVLDMRETPKLTKRQRYLDSFHKGYDARQGSTIAPPMVKIQPMYNDL